MSPSYDGVNSYSYCYGYGCSNDYGYDGVTGYEGWVKVSVLVYEGSQ